MVQTRRTRFGSAAYTAVRLLACALLVASACAGAAPPVPRSELTHVAMQLPVVLDNGTRVALEALMVRPAGGERLPLAILTHGSPRQGDAARRRMSAAQMSFQAEELARRGYVAVVVMRRGYGSSQGAWEESSGGCEAPEHERAARETARDLRAAVRALAARPDVDGTRVVVIGQSAGGMGSLALAADAPPGLRAVVNFAGGRGSRAPNEVCGEDRLIDAYAAIGKSARVPSLWIYTENDLYFRPALARRMFDAYASKGGPGELYLLPAFADDGHMLFVRRGGAEHWRPLLDDFLRRLELPTWRMPPSEPPVISIAAPDELADRYRAHWQRYLESSDNKAFAIAPNGRFAWRSGHYTLEDARRSALEACGVAACRIYSLNDAIYGDTIAAH